MWSLLPASLLGRLVLFDMAVQWMGWAVAVAFNTEIFYDITGSFTFITMCALSWWTSDRSARQTVQSVMVGIWALRLGSFLLIRILKSGGDRRFEKIKKSPQRFFFVWTLQGVWVFITLLPTLQLNRSSASSSTPLQTSDWLGWSLWAAGMVIETTADVQKYSFRSKPENKDKFIRHGLWSLSRHPNYLGEILLWLGLYVSASTVFSTPLESLSGLSPLFVYCLIVHVSGVPILEKAARTKWGDSDEYNEYVASTPLLVPTPGSVLGRWAKKKQE